MKPKTSAVPDSTLLKQLLNLALPIAITGGVQTGYHLINTFWVGRLGADAVAVVSVCMPVNLLLISFGSGLSLAGSILTAQNFGARNQQQVNHVAAQTLITMIAVALVFSIGGYFMAPSILRWMRVAETIFADALVYLRISFAGLIFLLLNSMYAALLRSIGEVKAPMRIVIASVALNAALDPLLIFGWGPLPALGVEGAAYATMITQMLTAFVGIQLMFKPRYGFTLSAADLIPDRALIARLFRLGVPASLEQSLQSLTVLAMIYLVAAFGTTAVAAYGIAFRVLTFLIIAPFGVSIAASILTGQSIGAGNREQSHRIARESVKLNFVLMTTLGVVIFFAARPLVTFFVPNDNQLIEQSVLVLRFFAATFPFSGIHLALNGVIRGAGATLPAMMMAFFGAWVVQIPLAYFLSRSTPLGELGLWWAAPLAAIFNTVVIWMYFRSRRWVS